jgi:hypothetical protein
MYFRRVGIDCRSYVAVPMQGLTAAAPPAPAVQIGRCVAEQIKYLRLNLNCAVASLPSQRWRGTPNGQNENAQRGKTIRENGFSISEKNYFLGDCVSKPTDFNQDWVKSFLTSS